MWLLVARLPARSILFPYTTLFRSEKDGGRKTDPAVPLPPESNVRCVRMRLRCGRRCRSAGHDPRMEVAESDAMHQDRKSTRLNSSHSSISYAVFCLKKKIRLLGRP